MLIGPERFTQPRSPDQLAYERRNPKRLIWFGKPIRHGGSCAQHRESRMSLLQYDPRFLGELVVLMRQLLEGCNLIALEDEEPRVALLLLAARQEVSIGTLTQTGEKPLGFLPARSTQRRQRVLRTPKQPGHVIVFKERRVERSDAREPVLLKRRARKNTVWSGASEEPGEEGLSATRILLVHEVPFVPQLVCLALARVQTEALEALFGARGPFLLIGYKQIGQLRMQPLRHGCL